MKIRAFALGLVASLLSLPAHATLGTAGFAAIKQCVMQNDSAVCHKAMTPSSYEIADRFISYKLAPCLPTNFTFESEEVLGGFTVVRIYMPAPDNKRHVMRLAFTGTEAAPLLDLPASLRIGLGEKWEARLSMAESLFLMIRANAGGELTCDQLEGLVPHK